MTTGCGIVINALARTPRSARPAYSGGDYAWIAATPSEQRGDPGEPAARDRPAWQAQQPVAVDEHRSELLARDGEADRRRDADLRDEQEHRGDVGGAAQAAEPAPPRDAAEPVDARAARARDGEHGDHRRGRDDEAPGAGRDRRIEVGAQLRVDGALERQRGAGGERERRPAPRARGARLRAHDQRRSGGDRDGAERRPPRPIGSRATPSAPEASSTSETSIWPAMNSPTVMTAPSRGKSRMPAVM